MATVIDVFGMSAKEVADKIVRLYGKDFILEIIRKAVDDIGVNKLARLASISPGAISNILRRRSIRDDTAKKILAGLAREKPYLLKHYIKSTIEELSEEYESIFGDLEKIIK